MIILLLSSCQKMSLGEVYAPNSFTPLRDGINDVFHIHIIEEKVATVDFKIYNRFKTLIYSSDELYITWDGMYKGQLSNPESYFWQLTYILKSGKEKYVDGTVILIE